MEFQFNTEVTGFTWNDGYWTIHTNHGEFETRYVINAAGVYSDVLHNMVSTRKLHITPRRGDYCLLDKSTGDFVSHTIFQLPGKLGKGVLSARLSTATPSSARRRSTSKTARARTPPPRV